MPYSPKVIARINSRPDTLGTRLGKRAVAIDIPAAKLSSAIGATRQSVYNWMNGGEVFVAYRPAVERIIAIMNDSKTAEEAWRKICLEFSLKT